MIVDFDTSDIEDYQRFLAVRRLPSYRIQGRSAWVPDQYAHLIGLEPERSAEIDYEPSGHCFDYQRDISRLAIQKRKFCVFADCGLGKTIILLEFARHAARAVGDRKVLIVSPLMVVQQTLQEAEKFYPGLNIGQVRASDLQYWLNSTDTLDTQIGITNYESLRDSVEPGRLGALILDESSMLKSHYGKWGQKCLELGAGLEWKLALTGTPAPNDRIEYANHAVFCDAFRSANAFLARYFINRGQTQNRWEIKPHALRPFYRDLSHWCIFLSNPAVYGWHDNCESIPPIHVHIEHVDMTPEQREAVRDLTGGLFAKEAGGIGQRSKLGQIAKGQYNGNAIETLKPDFMRRQVDSWQPESTIIWCRYNDEQAMLERVFPEAVSITGDTKYQDRLDRIDAFKSGRAKVLISKPKILGFGLNLQVATRQSFSTLQDSYEEFYQCVKRSNRIGSDRPLNVHIPVTEVEMPMVQTVLRKADRVQSDTEEQERLFKSQMVAGGEL